MLAIDHVAHLAGINEDCLALLFLVLRDKPECDRNSDAIEKLRWHSNNAFNQIIIDNFLSDLSLAAGLS